MRQPNGKQAGIERLEPKSCFEGGASSLEALIKGITPVVRARVTRVLGSTFGFRLNHAGRHDVEELTQDVMTLLFADSGRVLLAWDGERGLSFRNYVGLVAERSTRRIVRSRRHRGPYSPSEGGGSREDEIVDSGPGPESLLAAREYVEVVVNRIRDLLSPQARKLFDLLLIEGRPIDEVSHLTGLTREATYTWRSRLARMTRRVAREIENERPDAVGMETAFE